MPIKIITKVNSTVLFSYILVGCVGFIIDAGILTLLARNLGINIYVSRSCSFSVATFATWLLNRIFVFKPRERRSKSEYGRYFLVQTGGAILNLAVFTVLILWLPKLQITPVIPLAFGATFGLIFNFLGARHWVYRNNLLDLDRGQLQRH